jgi:hypothetical protein
MTVILLIALILAISTSAVLGYLVFLCQNKIDTYELWLIDCRDNVKDVYERLKLIDDKQMFEKDDDVGFVFTEILTLIEKLNKRIYDDIKEENENKKS